MTAYSRFVDAALSFQGCHYIWQGKGKYIWTPSKLMLHGFSDLNDPQLLLNVFDCSGLVTVALHMATVGKLDLRGSHSAQTILDTFPECDKDFGDGCLILYQGHVAIDLGRGRVVDAHRGNSHTTSVLAAIQANARVEVHRDVRPARTILGYRKVPLDKSELKTV